MFKSEWMPHDRDRRRPPAWLLLHSIQITSLQTLLRVYPWWMKSLVNGPCSCSGVSTRGTERSSVRASLSELVLEWRGGNEAADNVQRYSHTRTHLRAHTCTHTHTHMYANVRTPTYTHTCTHPQHIHTQCLTCTCTSTIAHAHARTQVHNYKHAHTQAFTIITQKFLLIFCAGLNLLCYLNF